MRGASLFALQHSKTSQDSRQFIFKLLNLAIKLIESRNEYWNDFMVGHGIVNNSSTIRRTVLNSFRKYCLNFGREKSYILLSVSTYFLGGLVPDKSIPLETIDN
jgi:hypothetical protein